MNYLSIENVSKRFGGNRVLQDVSIAARRGQVTALIGPNGAGKSTLANIVSGYVKQDAGVLRLGGQDISSLRAHKRVRLGLARTFQNLEYFAGMSVHDNVALGRFRHTPTWSQWLRSPGIVDSAETTSVLAKLELADREDSDIESLSFGQAKLVEPARMMTMEPSLLVMDEPCAGLTAERTAWLGQWITERAASGVAVLLIEHNMGLIMDVADHIFVLDHGELIAQGDPKSVMSNQVVIDAYLGGEVAS